MWQLVDHSASLSLGPLSCRVNVLEPWAGLTDAKWGDIPLPSGLSVLQIDVRELVAPNQLPLDLYVRGEDIVATYPPSEGRNVQTQIYWRSVAPKCSGKAVGVELILSAQTHLLDSRPAMTTSSTLPGDSVLVLRHGSSQFTEFDFESGAKFDFAPTDVATLFLFRPHGAAYSYAEMVHPSDFGGATVQRRGESSIRLTNQLFSERLEKGVIRRSRVCGVFLSRDQDTNCARQAYQAFVGEPLPLTT